MVLHIMTQINWERITLVCCIMVLIGICVCLLLKKLLRKWVLKSKQRPVKETLEFKKAKDPHKGAQDLKSARVEGFGTPGRYLPNKANEKNHTFLTLNKELTDRDKSGLMSFVQENNLKLDTIGPTEEEDPGKLDYDLEPENRGQYIDTISAKHSTKNSNSKEFFIEYRKSSNTNSKLEGSTIREKVTDGIQELEELEASGEDEPEKEITPSDPHDQSLRSPTN